MALNKPDLDRIEDTGGGSKIEKIPLVGRAVEEIRDSVIGTALVLGA